MILLAFAHRGEAQTFLKNLPVKSSPRFKDLYIGEEYSILLTGEGLDNSQIKLSYALALLEDVKEVINLGIAGSIDNKTEISEIIEVRTVYAQDEYKSFTLSESGIDLITSKQRVLDMDTSKKLSYVASLVDRELWALAHVCKEFNIKLRSFKLISDKITDAVVCELIKDKAIDYSDKLYDHLDSICFTSEEIDDHIIFSNEKFYFSLSQKRQYKTLIDALKIKLNLSEAQVLESIGYKDINKTIAKENTKLLLINLTENLYPFRTKILKNLDLMTEPIIKGESNFKFDSSLERLSFNFQTRIHDEKSLQAAIYTLSKFPWKEYEDLMRGNIDV